MEDQSGNNAANTNTPLDNADRDFDREPDETAAPESPEELAAAEAAEAAAQANAARARARLLSERAAREAMTPSPASPEAEAAAPEPEAAAPFAPKRGKQRWPVKTVDDDDKNKVKLADNDIKQTTVEDLWLEPRPTDMPLTRAVRKYQSKRAEGPETTVWQVEGRITAHKWEKDGDYHIVLQDLNSGYTMVVESPQEGEGSDGLPFVEDSSLVKDRAEQARLKLQEELNPKPFFQNANRKVRITGVGFFDILHGATGAAETNSIELHPVIDVEFLD